MCMNNPTQPEKYKRVLIVDDDEMDTFISSRILKSSLFAQEVIVKTCVASALDYLEKLVFESSVLPEIIFLDLNLPGKNGYNFLEELNNLAARNEVDFRVVILSNECDSYNEKTGKFEIYPMVEAVLEKPLDPDKLLTI